MERMKAAVESVKGAKGCERRQGSTTFQLKVYEDVLLEWLIWIVDQALQQCQQRVKELKLCSI